MTAWKRIACENAFEATVPANADVRLEDDQRLCVIALNSEETTEIHIALHSLPAGTQPPLQILGVELQRFVDIATGLAPVAGVSIEPVATNPSALQAVIKCSGGWWIVRAMLATPSEYFLIHWNGPTCVVDPVLRILESFRSLR